MIGYRTLGNRNVLARVCAELDAAGARAVDAEPALFVIGATSVAEAEAILATLSLGQRRRSVLVGIYERPDLNPRPGSVVDLLERFQCLGTVHLDEMGMPSTKEFVGTLGPSVNIPDLVGAAWLKGLHSENYGLWLMIEQQSVGELLVQLVTALNEQRTWFEQGPIVVYRPRPQ